jgi:hypothetical protein
MEIKENKEVTEIRSVIIARKCDVCGKVHEGEHTPDEWHSFNHHHQEWGNDSYDSCEYHEVCSPECYWVKFKECVLDLKGRNNAKVDEFEIQFARRLVNLL